MTEFCLLGCGYITIHDGVWVLWTALLIFLSVSFLVVWVLGLCPGGLSIFPRQLFT